MSREQKSIKIKKILHLNDWAFDFRIKWLMVCVCLNACIAGKATKGGHP